MMSIRTGEKLSAIELLVVEDGNDDPARLVQE